MAYDQELGRIGDLDYEYADDLLADLAEEYDAPESRRRTIVAEWLRKVRYEAVMADRKVRQES